MKRLLFLSGLIFLLMTLFMGTYSMEKPTHGSIYDYTEMGEVLYALETAISDWEYEFWIGESGKRQKQSYKFSHKIGDVYGDVKIFEHSEWKHKEPPAQVFQHNWDKTWIFNFKGIDINEIETIVYESGSNFIEGTIPAEKHTALNTLYEVRIPVKNPNEYTLKLYFTSESDRNRYVKLIKNAVFLANKKKPDKEKIEG